MRTETVSIADNPLVLNTGSIGDKIAAEGDFMALMAALLQSEDVQPEMIMLNMSNHGMENDIPGGKEIVQIPLTQDQEDALKDMLLTDLNLLIGEPQPLEEAQQSKDSQPFTPEMAVLSEDSGELIVNDKQGDLSRVLPSDSKQPVHSGQGAAYSSKVEPMYSGNVEIAVDGPLPLKEKGLPVAGVDDSTAQLKHAQQTDNINSLPGITQARQVTGQNVDLNEVINGSVAQMKNVAKELPVDAKGKSVDIEAISVKEIRPTVPEAASLEAFKVQHKASGAEEISRGVNQYRDDVKPVNVEKNPNIVQTKGQNSIQISGVELGAQRPEPNVTADSNSAGESVTGIAVEKSIPSAQVFNKPEITGQDTISISNITPKKFPAVAAPQIVAAAKEMTNDHRVTVIRLRLEPQSLGEIKIKLTFSNGELNAHFHTSSGLVRDAVENSLAQLRDTLSQFNVNLGEATASWGENQQGQKWHKSDNFSMLMTNNGLAAVSDEAEMQNIIAGNNKSLDLFF